MMRVFSFLILILFITSCDKFLFSKNESIQVVDTIVDFTSVDTFPSFKVCDSLIDKTKKANCFRNTIHQKIGEELQKHKLAIKDSINETVFVDLIINSKGKIVFKEMHSSQNIKNQLPELDSLVQLSVNTLDSIYPAIKKGMPVISKYQLPIKIVLKD